MTPPTAAAFTSSQRFERNSLTRSRNTEVDEVVRRAQTALNVDVLQPRAGDLEALVPDERHELASRHDGLVQRQAELLDLRLVGRGRDLVQQLVHLRATD